MKFPHCDQRILHAPGECVFCDEYSGWQELREAWGIAFTGHLPEVDSDIVMCPADYARDMTEYGTWSGNVPVRADHALKPIFTPQEARFLSWLLRT